MSSSPTDVPAEPAAPRLNVAALLFVLALLWVVPAAVGGYKAWLSRGDTPSQAGEAEKDKATLDAEKALRAATDQNRTSYIVLVVVGAVGAIGGLIGGVWSASSAGTMAAADHASQDRKLLLVVGGLSGLLMMALGVWFVVDEYQLATNWLTRRDTKAKDLWRVLVPALVFIAGIGLAFLAAQPARADERHDQVARRLVYGTSVAVTGLLLFGALVVLNGFVALKLPNRLDTTQTGYYTISPSTAEYVRGLTDKVTVHAFGYADQLGYAETQALLTACQELNPALFVVRFHGPGTSAQEMQKLRTKFPSVDFGNVAMIVALGEDETRYSSIRESDVLRTEGPEGEGGAPRRYYEGETRFVRELLYLSEGKTKATVYFTQGNGELTIDAAGGRRPPPDRSALELKSFLEKANVQVRPLPFDAKTGKLPDDAAVIVVADPTIPLGKELAEALQKFVTEPAADKKKGKLIVLAAPHANAKGDGVATTGLEELLKGFNIQLNPAFLYNRPTEQFPPELVVGLASPDLQESGNPVARALPSAARGSAIPLANPRALTILPNGNPAIQTTALIETPGGELFTWQEDQPQRDTDDAFKQLAALLKVNQRDAIAKKKISVAPVPLAAVATEGTTPRLVVVGASEFFNDATANVRRDNPAMKLIASSIDWLRDRPVVDVANKQYGYYTPQAKMDRMRLLFLPFGLLVLAVAGLAAGVWVVRRK